MKHCVFFPALSPQACLPFVPGAAATRGRLSLFEPEDCEDEVGGWGGDVAPRMAAPLDVWMLKWDLFFMNLFTVVPVVKENVSFFCFFFLFFLRCPQYLLLSKKHFTRSRAAAGSRDSVQDGGLEKFPAVCRFLPHTVHRFPSCPLGFS